MMSMVRRAVAWLSVVSLAVTVQAAPSRPVPPWQVDPFPSTYRPLPRTDFVITNATILDGAGHRLDHGEILVRGGKVAGIGAQVAHPAGVRLIDAQGRWVEELQQARLFGPEEATARDEAIARTKATMRILSLEIEKVSRRDGVIVPERLRERIRATGSTAPAFDRQHLFEDGHVSI